MSKNLIFSAGKWFFSQLYICRTITSLERFKIMQVNKNDVRFYLVETSTDSHYEMDSIEKVYRHMAKNGHKLYFFSEPNRLGDVVVSIPDLADCRKDYSELKAEFCDKNGCE